MVPDNVDRQAIDRVRDGHVTAGTVYPVMVIVPLSSGKGSRGRPRGCRKPAKRRRVPARRPRQVIDGRIVVTVEHIRTKAGGVTLEIDSCQAGASAERLVPDAGDAVGNRNAGQAGATTERPAPDVGDVVGNCVTSRFSPRIFNKHGLAFVEQDPIQTAIDGIICIPPLSLVRLGTPSNASAPMLVTLSGIVTLVRLGHTERMPRCW